MKLKVNILKQIARVIVRTAIRLYFVVVYRVKVEGIENILEMPTGCFEQTSSSLYPDILVLEYLRKYELNNTELEKKALNYISKGYQKLLTYEVDGEKEGIHYMEAHLQSL